MGDHTLDIDAGDTHTIGPGATDTYERVNLNGTLNLDGTLALVDDAPDPDPSPGADPFLPTEIDLPLASDTSDMDSGTATFLIGILAILLGAAYVLRNWAAGIALSLSVLVLIVAGLLGLGLELFWIGIIMTVVLLIAGLVVRWMS